MNKTIAKITVSALPLVLTAALVLPVLAQTTGSQNQYAPKSKESKTVNAACIQSAIEKRDTALMAAVDAYAAAAKSALSARKDAEKAAWNQTDRKARRNAMKTATVSYRAAVRTARKNFRDARQSAWTQFRADRKACGSSADSEEFGGQGQDESL